MGEAFSRRIRRPIALTLLLFSPVVSAATSLDLGAYGSNLFQRFSAPDGLASEVSSLSGFVRLRQGIGLGKDFFLEPAVGLLLPWRTGADGNVKVFTAHFDLPLLVPLFSFLAFRAGPGLQWTAFLSTPQEVSLNNGSATNLSTFHMPGRFRSLLAFIAEAGFIIRFSPKVALNLDAYVPNIASQDRRRLHGAITLGVTL